GIALGAPKIQWSEQFGDSSSFDAALVQEEERVRARVSRFDQSRLILSVGSSMEHALQSAENVAQTLQEHDLVGRFTSLTYLLPAQRTQQEIAQVIQQDKTLPTRFESAFGEAGFRPEMFEEFYATLRGELPPPLDAAMLQQSPLASVVD